MLFSKYQLLLYQLFLSYPDRSFYMHEIGRILKKKPGMFQKSINKLEKDGFIKSEYVANARFFYLNPNYFILKEISSIVKKMTGVVNIFKDDIRKFDKLKKQKHKINKPKTSKHHKIIKEEKLYSNLRDLNKEPISTKIEIPLNENTLQKYYTNENLWDKKTETKQNKNKKVSNNKDSQQLELF